MIQFNLLPDVKLQYIKAERTKHLFISISVLASAIALGVFVLLLLTVDILQKKNITDLTADIKTASSHISNTDNINRILTVQNQLGSLSGLHQQKPAASRLFGYIGQTTPSNVTISNLTADYTQNTLVITGNAPTIDDVNTFVDTLKFTTYTDSNGNNTNSTKAFSNVVLASFGRSTAGATYTVNLSFDPLIFSNTDNITLSVPKTVTTRSVTQQPLFQGGAR